MGKMILYIIKGIAAGTLNSIAILFLKWLLKQEPVPHYLEYFLYFGMVVLLYYSTDVILKKE